MMISTKGRYALRIMLDLAQNGQKECVSLKEIAQRQEISVKYLEAVISSLNRAGFVISKMGKGGGYRLSREPGDYTVGEILRTTEGILAPVTCLKCEKNTCFRADSCLTLPMWEELNLLVNQYLDSLSLQNLLTGNVKRTRKVDSPVSPIDIVGL